MRRIIDWVCLIAPCAVSVAALSGCGSSPPLRYYTLSEIAPESRPAATGSGANDPTPIRVDRITIPGELDRPEIVRRADANRLQISELSRWAAPLDATIRRVLSADLAARLPANLVLDPHQPASTTRSLTVDVQDFYGDTGCAVTLRAAWTLSPPQGESARGSDEVHVPAKGQCPESLPATMSRALAQLSDRIAVAIIAARGPPDGS